MSDIINWKIRKRIVEEHRIEYVHEQVGKIVDGKEEYISPPEYVELDRAKLFAAIKGEPFVKPVGKPIKKEKK